MLVPLKSLYTFFSEFIFSCDKVCLTSSFVKFCEKKEKSKMILVDDHTGFAATKLLIFVLQLVYLR